MYQKVSFISRRDAEGITPAANHGTDCILISISTPGPKMKRAVIQDGAFLDVLRLEFHDVDYESSMYKLIDDTHALQIFSFLKRNETACTKVIVHCDAGISRSAGVAKFIACTYGLNFPESYSLYNRLVFSTLTNAYYKTLYECEDGLPGLTPFDLPNFQQGETQ